MAQNTPNPGVQTQFQITLGGSNYGHIYLSKTPLISPPPPQGGAEAVDDKGSDFPAQFRHIAWQLEDKLAQLNSYLFTLNQLWSQFPSSNPADFQSNALFQTFAASAKQLRNLLGLATTVTWPLVPVTGISSDPYCSKKYSPIEPNGYPMTGNVTFIADQESLASWGFITDYVLILEAVQLKKDPSSSSSYYSAKATWP